MSTTRIQIGPADHGRAMTLEEFLEAEEEPGTATNSREECSR